MNTIEMRWKHAPGDPADWGNDVVLVRTMATEDNIHLPLMLQQRTRIEGRGESYCSEWVTVKIESDLIK